MKQQRIPITRKIEFDAGHRIPNHESKCRNPHGHRYVAEATVLGPVQDDLGQSEAGMVVDFGNLKGLMLEAFGDLWDHSFLVYKDDPFVGFLNDSAYLFDHRKIVILDRIPTVENLVQIALIYLSDLIDKKQEGLDPDLRRRVEKLRLYETPNCWADAWWHPGLRIGQTERLSVHG